MIPLTPSEIANKLESHRLWLKSQTGGEWADLRKANLSGANLSGANLTGADLRGADLSGADFREADLTGANLRGANLTGADLTGADLIGADLRWADLSGANLTGADLRGANLSGANLSMADLREANLRGADLSGASGLFSVFSAGRHHGIATSSHIAIGCERHTHAEWRADYNVIGAKNGYSESEIERYRVWIFSLDWLLEEESNAKSG